MPDNCQSTQFQSLHQDQATQPVEWTVGKLLLNAQLQTGEAFEQYLLFQAMREQDETFTDQDLTTYETALEQAIVKHERIIENLEQARAAMSAESTGSDEAPTNG